MNKNEQIVDMVRIMNECCNVYDEQGNHVRNKCYECEEWSYENHCCCSYNTKEATALYNADYRKASDITELEEKLADATANWQKIHDAYTEDCKEHYNKGRSDVARDIIAEIDNALHDMAVEYEKAGHPEYFAVCEMVYHKVIRRVEKKYEVTNNESK